MAPGLPEQKFGTMWPTVDFRAIIWAILSLISAFVAMRLPTALSCWPKDASKASAASVAASGSFGPTRGFCGFCRS